MDQTIWAPRGPDKETMGLSFVGLTGSDILTRGLFRCCRSTAAHILPHIPRSQSGSRKVLDGCPGALTEVFSPIGAIRTGH